MERRGGRLIREKLEKLKADLNGYFGAINEFRKQLRKAEQIPPKPAALILYERIKSTGLHLKPGGLLDQPHIWLMQFEIVHTVKAQWDAIFEQASKASSNVPDLMAPRKFN